MEPEQTPTTIPTKTDEIAQNKRKRRILLFNIISFLIVFTALGWAVVTYFHLDKSVYTNDAQVESYVNPINTRVQGYISSIRFAEHQHVKKGDTLVVLDDREYRIQVKQAEAVVLNATAGKTVVNVSQDVSNNSIAVSAANIEEIKARLDNAEVNFQRYANLLKEDVVTKFQYDQQKTERDALKAKYESLMHSQQGARYASQETGKRIDVAKADILRAEAALDYSRLNLSYTVITAPYDGTVGRKVIEEGQFVQPGQTMVSIVRSNEHWINANYVESQLAAIAPGRKVKIHIDALDNKTFYGRITSVSEATGSRYSAVPVDNSTGNFVKVQQRFPVRIDFVNGIENKDLEMLRAGMNAEVELVK
ncbi:HlyD family secretion protein [Mucilaginibacter sp. BJC16-A38]|uniref:HlyD family secretion protein n=1 Tax=Mucilaginibacter phenanthrenivorans TaxID=1234842 RepID=UPI00215846BA|nr:HlyD family secretion protein [Mucilaginibacter phenanthrenivorans]MCR8560334.1 HlyD family secretion protein [Mucilaginibacter phenanthrenivorans]